MRFQVPQFVDIQDKIIGPFTIHQFLMYVVAVMLLIPIYLYSDLSLFITIAIPVFGVAAVFAHLKIYGRTFTQVTVAAISYVSKGQLYVWRRLKTPALKIVDEEWDAARASAAADHPSASLSSVAQSLETTGNISKEDLEDPLVV